MLNLLGKAEMGDVRTATQSTDDVSATHADPPRLIIYNPDDSVSIGVDKDREHLLQPQPLSPELTNLAAVMRQSLMPATDQPGIREELIAWNAIYNRQKVTFVVALVVDVLYLFPLIILRYVWSPTDDVSGAVNFFIGQPNTLPVSYMLAAFITDGIAIFGAVNDMATITTMFLLWSFLMAIFGIGRMPLLFVLYRVLLILLALQIRLAVGRMRQLLAPTNFVGWVSNGVAGIVHFWRDVAREGRTRRTGSGQEQHTEEGTATTSNNTITTSEGPRSVFINMQAVGRDGEQIPMIPMFVSEPPRKALSPDVNE